MSLAQIVFREEWCRCEGVKGKIRPRSLLMLLQMYINSWDLRQPYQTSVFGQAKVPTYFPIFPTDYNHGHASKCSNRRS